MLNGQELAIACAQAADELKAEDVRIFDLRGISTLTDFMVVCSGNSQPHLKAIIRDVESLVREKGADPANATEGKAASRWVVIDFVPLYALLPFSRDAPTNVVVFPLSVCLACVIRIRGRK